MISKNRRRLVVARVPWHVRCLDNAVFALACRPLAVQFRGLNSGC